MLARVRAVPKLEVLVPHPVIAEISYAVAQLPRSKRKEALRERFELVKSELVRAEWTDGVSEAFGDIKSTLQRRGTRIEDFDVAIAAHARAREAIRVTANLGHMIRVPGLRAEDWAV